MKAKECTSDLGIHVVWTCCLHDDFGSPRIPCGSENVCAHTAYSISSKLVTIMFYPSVQSKNLKRVRKLV